MRELTLDAIGKEKIIFLPDAAAEARPAKRETAAFPRGVSQCCIYKTDTYPYKMCLYTVGISL